MGGNVRVSQALATLALGTLVAWIMLRSSDAGHDATDHDATDHDATDRSTPVANRSTMGRAPATVAVQSARTDLPAPTATPRSEAFSARGVSAARGSDHAISFDPTNESIELVVPSGFAWLRKLDQAFKPLMEQCIDLATARKPGLHGLLSFRVITTPTKNERVVVESVKPLDNNQIEDPELFECLRESAFSLEELSAPPDFDFWVPIAIKGTAAM
jgi:hypothetical protein